MQTLRRFIHRLVAETETFRNASAPEFCAQLDESVHRFLRIHVDFATGGRVIGANRQQRVSIL